MSIAEKVKSLRNKNGYSQEKLAEETGLSLRTIQRVENSETEPRGDTLNRIAGVFKVSPDEILEWDQTEDYSTLYILNLSALSFLFHPILGVIVPLIIWFSRKDIVKKANEIGKNLINFQITFTAFIYFLKGILFLIPLLSLEIGEWLDYSLNFLNIPPYLFPIILYGIPYLYNFILIVINTYRIKAGEKVRYFPSVRILN